MTVTYQVVSPLAVVQDENGEWHHHYQGAVIEGLGSEQVDHLLGLGFIAKVGSDDAVIVPGTEFLGVEQVAAFEAARPVELPAKAARHDLWVDYAVSKGADRTEAEALTKSELIELYG